LGWALHKLALVGIAKNEGMFMLDWVNFHLASGFDEVVVADDSSIDGSLELLEAISKFLPVRVFRVNSQDAPKQQSAYRRSIKMSTCDLLAFADLDEFFLSSTDDPSGVLIKDIFEDEDVNALAVNWQIVGSSEITSSLGAPIRNNHIKSVVRKSEVAEMHVHHAILKGGKYMQVDGVTHLSGPSNESQLGVEDIYPCGGLSTHVIHEPLRLLHFATKASLEGFYLTRPFRQRASSEDSKVGLKANRAFLVAHTASGSAAALPFNLRKEFDALSLRSLKSISAESDLLAGVVLELVSIEHMADGSTSIAVSISCEKDLSGDVEITVDGQVYAILPFSISADSNIRELEVHLHHVGEEFLIRIPGVWTSRIRLYRAERNLIVDEIYQELTFRLARAERLILSERLANLESAKDKKAFEELTRDFHEKIDSLQKSLELTESNLQAAMNDLRSADALNRSLSEEISNLQSGLNALKSRSLFGRILNR
jgi:hypothetical protein